jgi:SulP family sulfate permease
MSAVAIPGSDNYVHLVIVMSLLAGIFKLMMGVVRLGVLVNFVSQTVVVGFTAGAGLLIMASQLNNFFGLDLPHGLSLAETVYSFGAHLRDLDWYVASVAIITLLTGLWLRRRFPRVPYMIAAMVTGSVYAYVLRFVPACAVAHHIHTVPALPGALPPFALPALSLDALRKTASAAVAVGIIGLTEAISISRAIAARSEQRLDANQEFIGQGLANIAGAFFSAYAASGSLNRSGANYEAGAKTPLSSVFSAVFLVIVLFAVAPLARYLPLPAMAGVLILVGWGLIDVARIRKVFAVSRSETVVLIVTLAATVLTEIDFAIFIGVTLSLMLYLRRTAHPRVIRRSPDRAEHGSLLRDIAGLEGCEQVEIVQIRGSVFFGAAEYVREALRAIEIPAGQRACVVVDAIGVNFIDAGGARMLAEEALRLRRAGTALYVYRVNDEVMDVLERGGTIDDLGRANVHPLYGRARVERLAAL